MNCNGLNAILEPISYHHEGNLNYFLKFFGFLYRYLFIEMSRVFLSLFSYQVANLTVEEVFIRISIFWISPGNHRSPKILTVASQRLNCQTIHFHLHFFSFPCTHFVKKVQCIMIFFTVNFAKFL